MNGLEQTFYIMAIVFMSLMFVVLVILLAAVLVIRAKINKIHDAIESKIDLVTSLTNLSAGAQAIKQAKKVIKKTKR
jgi:cell division protein FtsL